MKHTIPPVCCNTISCLIADFFVHLEAIKQLRNYVNKTDVLISCSTNNFKETTLQQLNGKTSNSLIRDQIHNYNYLNHE